MALSVGKLFHVLSQEDCREALACLLESSQPLTQGQLSKALNLKSGTISRRMKEVEDVGLVSRPSPHAPYELLFSKQTRELLILGAELARDAAAYRANEDDSYARNLRKGGMRGGSLLDQARETQ